MGRETLILTTMEPGTSFVGQTFEWEGKMVKVVRGDLLTVTVEWEDEPWLGNLRLEKLRATKWGIWYRYSKFGQWLKRKFAKGFYGNNTTSK